MLEIIKDYEAMKVSIGKYEINRPYIYWRKEYECSIKDEILRKNEIDIPSFEKETGKMELDFNGEATPTPTTVTNIKLRNKYYAEHLGTMFNRRLYANMWELWIRPNFSDRASRCLRVNGKNWKSYNYEKVDVGLNFKEHIRDLESSGRDSLVPLVILFEVTIDELMDGVGPEVFAPMESASYTRNLKFSNYLELYAILLAQKSPVDKRYEKLTPKQYGELSKEFGSFLGCDERSYTTHFSL